MEFKEFLTGFRKFTMAVIFLMVAVALLVLEYIPAQGWLSDVGSVMTAFMATNVGEHIIAIGRQWIESKVSESKGS